MSLRVEPPGQQNEHGLHLDRHLNILLPIGSRAYGEFLLFE